MMYINPNEHAGEFVASSNGFDIIDCKNCGFKHITPVPTEKDLERAYKHDYYSIEKPLYIDRYKEDLEWWNMVYDQRLDIFEKFLGKDTSSILDIGSGPGFFLLRAKERGWKVLGIEPSLQAAKHSKGLGLDIVNDFYSNQNSRTFGLFDAVNLSEVLEHIPDPLGLLTLVKHQLNKDGIICLVVPNDFNPIQLILEKHLGFTPWWIAPPHHINYFNIKSLSGLVQSCGFEVIYTETTFPIDIFLLMGENYVGNDPIGRLCHKRRMNLEKVLVESKNNALLSDLYSLFASKGLGREIVLYARKKE